MAKKVTSVCFSVICIKVHPVCANKLNEVHGTTYDCITQLSALILLYVTQEEKGKIELYIRRVKILSRQEEDPEDLRDS